MDGQRFDALTRAFAVAPTRRRFLAAAAGAVLAMAKGGDAGAQRTPRAPRCRIDGDCPAGSECRDRSCAWTDPMQTMCDGQCLDTTSDFLHCDGCNTSCPVCHDPGTSTHCDAGICRATPGFPDTRICGDTCVNVTMNRLHCGGCFQACARGEACIDGVCDFCPQGQGLTYCPRADVNTCVDLDTDPAN